LAEANGYKEAVIAGATGEGERFVRVLAEFQKAPEVTRKRLYIETMEEDLCNTNKIMIDQEGGNNMMYLPLDQIIKNTDRTQRVRSNSGGGADSKQTSTNRNTSQRGGR
jgi:membrane protease subunit HflK